MVHASDDRHPEASGSASGPDGPDGPDGAVGAVGLAHPGEMGAAVGRCLAERGFEVLWAAEHRSAATAGRAAAAGLTDAGTIAAMAGRAGVLLSVCPPHAAIDVATAARGFGGLYVDANAIAPATAREVAAIVESGGATYVDGGIIGPPPAEPGSTRLYLSGPAAGEVSALFAGTVLDARVVPGDPYAASAVKVAYAAWTKGSAALLLAARGLAEAEGVGDVLLAEWELSQPALQARYRAAQQSAAAKGWRWIAEMEQIAQAMAADGLPAGFHLAAADIYREYAGNGQARPASL